MKPDVTQLSWAELNESLLKCDDAVILRHWLDAILLTGSVTRAMRVYGRMSTVRRASELRELRAQLKLRQKAA